MGIEIAWQEWLGLIVRWVHIMVGIAWIGTSFYFIWLDQSLKKTPALPDRIKGESWSVHGGGFYHVQKYLVAPDQLPGQLHWFKYEAYFTWVSGFVLLGILYYWSAESFLMDPNRATMSISTAISISIGSLVGGWVSYDLLCRSKLGSNTTVLSLAVFTLVVAIGWGLTQVFNDRAAFLHIGAVIGTIMTANVFFIIIPNQKKVVADLKKGKTPKSILGSQAKQRSLHNNYLTLPVVLFMISSHYPILFVGGRTHGWLVIAFIIVIGGIVRHFFNARHLGVQGAGLLWQWPVVAVLTIVLILFLSPSREIGDREVTDAKAFSILETHCTSCHAKSPADPAFQVAPAGLYLESLDELKLHASRILTQAVMSEAMPLGNRTGMTKIEREELGLWIKNSIERSD
tara:strand:- start:495 stop:1697 length:1203 start_codon:yes stop_codon:yes gene_type:complete